MWAVYTTTIFYRLAPVRQIHELENLLCKSKGTLLAAYATVTLKHSMQSIVAAFILNAFSHNHMRLYLTNSVDI